MLCYQTEPRSITASGFGLDRKEHEYISEKDNNAVYRGAMRMATFLGLNKRLPPEEQECVEARLF